MDPIYLVDACGIHFSTLPKCLVKLFLDVFWSKQKRGVLDLFFLFFVKKKCLSI